jgi:DNA mismatch repair protein MutL
VSLPAIVASKREGVNEKPARMPPPAPACHAAVRAGDRLTPEEIAALLEQRELARDSHHCPHGRPTSLLFTMAELGKQFRRG